MLPEHNRLVQVMMFKLNDEAPDYPKSRAFIDNMKDSVKGKILNYRVMTEEFMDSEKYRDIVAEEEDNITVH
jgi:uncharacterized protein Usg